MPGRRKSGGRNKYKNARRGIFGNFGQSGICRSQQKKRPVTDAAGKPPGKSPLFLRPAGLGYICREWSAEKMGGEESPLSMPIPDMPISAVRISIGRQKSTPRRLA
jgi:hypothetical protein